MARVTPLMDNDELKAWLLRRFGAPLLKVEVTEMHLDDAIEGAKRWFVAKKGARTMASVAVLAGQAEVEIPYNIDVVYDVTFTAPNFDLSLVFTPYAMQDDHIPYDTFRAAGTSGGIYSSIVQVLQTVEMAKRVLGSEPDWRQDDRILRLFPTPKSELTVIVEGKSNEVPLDQLNERDFDLIKRYALAFLKRDLGRIRTKYTEGFASAQGTTTLDGQSLLEEATSEMEALDEEIAMSGYPMLFLVG